MKIYFSETVAQSCSVKKVFLENLQNSQENTCARVSLFNKVAVLRLSYVRTPFLTEHLQWLLLSFIYSQRDVCLMWEPSRTITLTNRNITMICMCLENSLLNK